MCTSVLLWREKYENHLGPNLIAFYLLISKSNIYMCVRIIYEFAMKSVNPAFKEYILM